MKLIENVAYAARLHQALDRHLTTRERAVLIRMIQGQKMVDIAREFGVQPRRVRQIRDSLRWKADRVFRGLLR